MAEDLRWQYGIGAVGVAIVLLLGLITLSRIDQPARTVDTTTNARPAGKAVPTVYEAAHGPTTSVHADGARSAWDAMVHARGLPAEVSFEVVDQACRALDAGASWDLTLAAVAPRRRDLTVEEREITIYLLGAGVGAFCPEHTGKIR